MRYVILGGGCYGSFYARQLLRARDAGALAVSEVVVVDHGAGPRALRELPARPGLLRFEEADWREFLDRHLSALPADATDRLVTPPFTPHLAVAWLLDRLRALRPGPDWSLEPFRRFPGTPFEHQAEGGPLLVSHADWVCPVHCIEPDTCPRTRGARYWDLDRTVREFTTALADGGQPVDRLHLFHCHHIAYGVAGYAAAELPAALAAILRDSDRVGAGSAARYLVGTVSHCHGALHLLTRRPGTFHEDAPRRAAGPDALTRTPMEPTKTILIVEDNEDNLVVYRTILEHVGYNVIEARDGEEGIERATEAHPDLILMDISIPKIDGWEATRRLKEQSATSDIPIIALTAHALEEDREKALEVGCDGYLAKPIEPRRVVEEVGRYIGGAAAGRPGADGT